MRQLWREQRIDARFADVNALVVCTPEGDVRIPFSPSSALPVVDLQSKATDSAGGAAAATHALSADSSAVASDARPPDASSVASSRPLGFHRVGATAHISRLPAAQAAELLHRRSLLGVDKLRASPHTTVDAPRVLASASAVPPSVASATARIRKAPHSTTLSAPSPEPGVLHVDLKELVLSIGGYRYVVFAIDE